jgi:hypothetical protein
MLRIHPNKKINPTAKKRGGLFKALASMMKFFVNPKSLSLLIMLSMSMLGYFILLSYLGDIRVADSSLDGEEMYIWEMLLLMISLFSLFYLWVCSIIHCFKNKSKFLSIIIAFIWPLSYFYSLYVLVINWGQRNAS